MHYENRLSRFVRKPLPEKWAAMNATLAHACALATRLHRALLQAKAGSIDFHSGLGDSANLLYGLVRAMKPEICVEIGSARGKSACYIGMALKENGNGKLYAIDPHTRTEWNDSRSLETLNIFRANISALGLTEQVVIVHSFSSEAAQNWTRPIDLIFIDGDHTYDGVKQDWELFVPHVRPFGVVLFHDTIWDLITDQERVRPDMGVPRFVDELREQGYQTVTINRDCGLSLIQPTLGGRPLRREAASLAEPAKSFPAS
jgi:predicted O-methyltransferase YrrM